MHKFLAPALVLFLAVVIAQPQVQTVVAQVENNLSTTLVAAAGSAKHAAKNTTDTTPTNPHQAVSVRVSTTTLPETSTTAAIFTIWRAGATTTALTVPFTISGTAIRDTDYRLTDNSLAPLTGNSATIPAGQVGTTVRLFPIADSIRESTETATLTIASSTSYNLGSENSVTTSITDVAPISKPVISVRLSPTSVAESSRTAAIFTVSRTGAATAAFMVPFTIAGTATRGTDYFLTDNSLVNLTSNTATIPAGSLSTTVRLFPKTDAIKESTETATLSVASSTSYTLGTTHSATASITDVAAIPTGPVTDYDILVKPNITLGQASTTIANLGGKVLIEYPHLHGLSASLTASQQASLKENSEVYSVQSTRFISDQIESPNLRDANPSKISNVIPSQHYVGASTVGTGTYVKPRVAIVDDATGMVDYRSHAELILNTYLYRCGPSCADPNPILVDDMDASDLIPGQTEASADDSIIYAVSQGANLVNLSQNLDGGTLTDADLNMLSYVHNAGAIIIQAAGNSPGFSGELTEDSPYRENVIEVGGVSPSNPTKIDTRYAQVADVYALDSTGPDPDVPTSLDPVHYGTSASAPFVTAILADEMVEEGVPPVDKIKSILESGYGVNYFKDGGFFTEPSWDDRHGGAPGDTVGSDNADFGSDTNSGDESYYDDLADSDYGDDGSDDGAGASEEDWQNVGDFFGAADGAGYYYNAETGGDDNEGSGHPAPTLTPAKITVDGVTRVVWVDTPNMIGQ